MSDNTDTTITTDRDTIREWVEESGGTPAYRTTTEGDREMRRPYVHHADRGTVEGVEETSWDEFFTTFEEDELALIRRSRGEGHEYEVVNRTEAAERAALENDQVEAALLDGETVRSTVTETRVIEREVVETVDIESEVVDSEEIRDAVLVSDLISREIVDTELVDEETIRVEIDEMREVEREVVERKTVESRIVNHDIEGFETLESDTLEERIDMSGVERQLLSGDLLGGRGETEEIADVDLIESRITEDRTIRSELYERRLIREDIVDHKVLTYRLEEEELVSSEMVDSEVIEDELVDIDAIELEGAADVDTATASAVDTTTTETGMTMDEETMTETEATAEPDPTGTEPAPGTTADTTATAETGGASATVDEHSTGNRVVDASGEEVGIVTEVDDRMIYVDPHPSITERIRARLGWENHDDDDLPIDQSRIAEVTAEEIRLADLEETGER